MKTVFYIKAAVCLFFGVALVFFPTLLLEDLLGISALTAGGLFMARLYGASLFGNLMLSWFARESYQSEAKKAILLDLFVYDAIGFVLALYYQLNGLMNWLGWSIVLVYLFFTIGFGYPLFTKKDA